MAETPVGYLPDVPVTYSVVRMEDHVTQVLRALNGREQRRSFLAASGQRLFTASTAPLLQPDRKALYDFLHARRGKRDAFYFLTQDTITQKDVSGGSVTAQSVIIVPFSVLNQFGSVIGTLTDVRVAGVTKAFSRYDLDPRLGTYATLRFYSASSQYVDCGSNASLRPSGDFSVGGWVNVIALAADGLIGNENNNASGYSLRITGGGQASLRLHGAGTQQDFTSGLAVGAQAWAHFFAVRSGSTVTMYVNGVATGGAQTVTITPVAATLSTRIGEMGTSGNFMNGMLNELRFYDAAISAGEVLNIYRGNATPSANLRGWWPLTEGTGTTANDLSGNANTGTLTAGPVWCAGEAEITFTGGNQTGAVTLTGTLRERIIARSDNDRIKQGFYGSADIEAIFDLAILELI